jgi:two-component system OmpR family response regulator
MRVLVAEDEPTLAERVSAVLERGGFLVDIARDGEAADFLGQTETYDAAVLDLGLPRRDGLELLRAWRAAGVALPVLILTARGRWADKEAGFEAGADDYLVKPFEPGEVLLRVRALVRRAAGHASPEIRVGPIVLDTRAARVLLDGAPVELTAQEFRVLQYFMHHPGRVVSRTELSEHSYGTGRDPDSNSLDVLVSRIRRKILPARIGTVRGRGWKLSAP